jgi:methionyl-tRNA formyltransferase
MDDGADTGPIAAQEWCWIQPGDTPETLWRRDLAPMGLRLFERVLTDLAAGRVPSTPQRTELATWEPAFRPARLSER